MFISDIRREFYDTIIGRIKHVLLINCGGCIDLIELLQPPDDIVLFVADCHRPLDVYNIYNDGQIRILNSLRDDETVPAFDDIFREDEIDDSQEEEDRIHFNEAALKRKRERRLWEEQRQKVLFNYMQFSSFGSSSSSLMFNLAWKLSKDSIELLWYTVVGDTDLFLSERTEKDKYLLYVADFQNHASRLNHRSLDRTQHDNLHIVFEKDMLLAIYRHWSLLESMRHSPYTATKLKLWTLKGEKRLFELFAEVGLPLLQCKQKFCGMDVSLRNEVNSLLESKIDKYGIETLFYQSFTLSQGFKNKFSASDYVFGLHGLLETVSPDRSLADSFLAATDGLNLSKQFVLEKGIENCKLQLQAIYRQVQTFLDMHQVISAGPFLYATVMEGSPDSCYFATPHSLSLLARFTLQAHVAVSHSRKAKDLPLVITSADIFSSDLNICLVCGIPPLSEDSQRNLFGKAFEQAAERTKSHAEMEFFDTNIIRLNVDHRSKFFDALISLLS